MSDKHSRYIKLKVEHYSLFMFSPPKISWVISGIKDICLHLLPVFYLIQPSSKQFICFDFQKQNSVLPIVFYVPWFDSCTKKVLKKCWWYWHQSETGCSQEESKKSSKIREKVVQIVNDDFLNHFHFRACEDKIGL